MFKAIKISRFKKEVKSALATGVLSEDKLSYLKGRAIELGLGEDILIAERREDFLKRSESITKRIVANRRFSPQEEQLLNQLARDLQVTTSFDKEYEQYRRLWEFDQTGNVTLKPVDAPINLLKGEQCFFQADANWKQLNTVRTNLGYSGIGVSVRVSKGVRLYSGKSAPRYTQHDELALISTGHLYLTTNRVIFTGSKKSMSSAYNKIVELKDFQDGLEVVKSSGKPDYFEMTPLNADLASMTIRKLLSEE